MVPPLTSHVALFYLFISLSGVVRSPACLFQDVSQLPRWVTPEGKPAYNGGILSFFVLRDLHGYVFSLYPMPEGG